MASNFQVIDKTFIMVVFLAGATIGFILGAVVSHQAGLELGVKLGNTEGFRKGALSIADNKFVVVNLPDGTRVVVENKPFKNNIEAVDSKKVVD